MPQQLIKGMSSRRRRPNWTDQECLLLAQLMQERKGIIRGKCITGVSIQDKRQAWEGITKAINTAFPQIQRTVSDCNKKWENLIAKSREEIKRKKRQADTEDLSLEQLSTVTQVVINVMNLSDMLQQNIEDSSMLLLETQQNSEDDGNDETTDECSNKHSKTEIHLPSLSPEPSTSKSLAVQFITPRATDLKAPAERLGPPCSISPPVVHGTTLQERMDLELSVLRRQEAVLKLQEEYYTLKIKLMKKQMEEPLPKE